MGNRVSAGAVSAISAIVLLILLLGGGDARAGHDGGLDCYACHSLNGANVEQGTTSMAISAMTEIKQHGWTAGQRLACTFCHRSTNAPAIPDALSDFTTMGVSRHPSGKNFVTKAADNTAYLSNDNTTFPQSLDCQDCHDVTLTSYPNHDNTTWLNNSGAAGRTKSTNPFGLKNVTAPKAYDDLCRNCHSNAANFSSMTRAKSSAGTTKLFLTTHDNGVDNAANAIRDIDNTHFRPQDAEYANKRQCNVCHDAHFSTNLHLFSDGHELDWNGVAKKSINEDVDCTTVCHYRGDSDNNFDRHGHGEATNWSGTPLNRNCNACHDTTKPHNPTSTDYSAKYRFPSLDNSWLTASIFGKPVKSICAQCHGSKPTHKASRAINGTTEIGCLDCHDQHAKSSDNNVMMIRSTNRVPGTAVGVTSGVGSTVGSEPVYFQKSPKYNFGGTTYDFYSATSYQGDTSAGFCDQRACHGNRSVGTPSTPLIPLSTFMASGKHSGNNLPPNYDCESCHSHSDAGGSFRASSSCTTCHGQPPPPKDNTAGPIYPRDETLSPHVKHAGTTGYGYNCRLCHVNYTDNNYHNTYATTGVKTFQSVFFDNSVKRGTSAYDNGTFACTNITCHSDGRGNAPNTTPTWFTGTGGQVLLGCADCHNHGDVGSPMNTGAHLKHINSGYRCSTCHFATVTDNNLVLAGYSNHANGTRNVVFKAPYDNGSAWDNGATTCSGISCHGGNTVNWFSDVGKVTCDKCHAGNGDVDDFGNGTVGSNDNNGITAKIDNTEWMWSGHGRDNAVTGYDVSGNPSARLLSGGGTTGTNKCAFCHDPSVGHYNSSNPFRLANNNVFSQGWNGACYVCHAAASVGNSAPGYAPANDCTASPSGTYGARTSTSKVGSNHYNPGSTVNARHSTTYNGGKFCWDCHDPHGDRTSGSGNIFMIGKRVTKASDNVFGFPVNGNDNSNRPAPVFTGNTTGANYADNTTRLGICQVCHTAGVVPHWTSTTGDGHNAAQKCTDCHKHDDGFRGAGGNNIEQFFDNAYRAASASNYNDLSRHTLRADNVLAYPGQVDCYTCHGVATGAYKNNECLTCHWENRTSGTPAHPDNKFQWAIPRTPATQFSPGVGENAVTDDFCLQCHGTLGTADNTLGSPAKTPVSIYTFGETSWTGGSGHGQTTIKLAKDNAAGPPAYSCRDCHYSNGSQGTGRDNTAPGFHASQNRHLVRSDNMAVGGREYPHPADTAYTPDQRAGRMDNWCSTQCHGNLANGQAKDDNVIDHTWDKVGGQSKTGAQTHPTDFLVVTGAFYQQATGLPYSEYTSGALPGAGNGVCITCHNPHGGGDIRDSGNSPVALKDKNMLRMSPADNVSTLCKQCHK